MTNVRAVKIMTNVRSVRIQSCFIFAVLQRGMLVRVVPITQDAGSELSAMLEMCVVSMFIIHIHWPVRSAQLQSVFVRLWVFLFIIYF